MQVVLIGLAGCAAVIPHKAHVDIQVDVVHIFEKQRKVLTALNIEVKGQRAKEGPRPLETIHIIFQGKGSGITEKELGFAVRLATEKYCGVHATLSKSATITWEAVMEN
jgi:uncharacterized OsmC-like protein